MGKSKGRGKLKNSSEGTSGQLKSARNGGSPALVSDNVSVCDSIRFANSVLFDETLVTMDNSVFEAENSQGNEMSPNSNVSTNKYSRPHICVEAGSSGSSEPSISDVMKLLKGMDRKITQVDNKLRKLDILEQKVSQFEAEISQIWKCVQESLKSCNENVSKVTGRVQSLKSSLGAADEEIKADDAYTNTLYVQSQSMRNNSIFSNIVEGEHEKPEQTEDKTRRFMVEKLKLTQDDPNKLKLERVHRMGGNRSVESGARNGEQLSINDKAQENSLNINGKSWRYTGESRSEMKTTSANSDVIDEKEYEDIAYLEQQANLNAMAQGNSRNIDGKCRRNAGESRSEIETTSANYDVTDELEYEDIIYKDAECVEMNPGHGTRGKGNTETISVRTRGAGSGSSNVDVPNHKKSPEVQSNSLLQTQSNTPINQQPTIGDWLTTSKGRTRSQSAKQPANNRSHSMSSRSSASCADDDFLTSDERPTNYIKNDPSFSVSVILDIQRSVKALDKKIDKIELTLESIKQENTLFLEHQESSYIYG